jgi:hypothetical protein
MTKGSTSNNMEERGLSEKGTKASKGQGGINMLTKTRLWQKQNVASKEESDEKCMHCGVQPLLAGCPEITTEQLGEILI